MTTPSVTITSPEQVREALLKAQQLIHRGLDSGPVVLSLGRQRRTVSQNRKLWPMLADISKQVKWYGVTLKPEEWKHVFSAALHKIRAVPGIDGGVVMLGKSTSEMSKAQLTELIEYIYAFGAERRVRWSEPALKAYEMYGSKSA